MNLTALRAKHMPNKKSTLTITIVAIFCALSIVISFLEMSIPSFLLLPPGSKMGFSNIVTMFVCSALGILPALSIVLAKSLFVFMIKGFTAFLMSFCGGLLSSIVVYVLFNCRTFSTRFILTGVTGALFHNMGQLLVAVALTSPCILYYAPFLIIFAIITGSITGFALKVIFPKVNKIFTNLKG